MTLIAAYPHKGIPVLIGDVALTKGQTWSARKKVYIISDNFAVGWTGHMVVAKEVITSIKTAFCDKSVTKDSMEDFFRGYKTTDFGTLDTKFIGWIIDDKPYCFLWNCLYPKEVFYSTFYFEGTGQKYFEGLRSREWQGGGSVLPV